MATRKNTKPEGTEPKAPKEPKVKKEKKVVESKVMAGGGICLHCSSFQPSVFGPHCQHPRSPKYRERVSDTFSCPFWTPQGPAARRPGPEPKAQGEGLYVPDQSPANAE